MSIEETAAKIKSMEIRGAGKIARAAALALKEYVKELDESRVEKVIEALNNAGDTLRNTRPTAVSLENAVETVLNSTSGETVSEIKENVITAADKFISNSLNAMEKIAELCANKIKDNSTILTHCNSTVAVKSIIKAFDQGKTIRVYATETRPWGQGYITSQALADAGVDTTLIVDSAVLHFMKEIDLVIIGADTITTDGTVINKIGTSQLALCAKEFKVPVLVCAETYKFSQTASSAEQVVLEERNPEEIAPADKVIGVSVRNPVFDATPAKYIGVIITEIGIISPNETNKIINNSV
jgi:ribose 1,5-bisphosphate isomerase